MLMMNLNINCVQNKVFEAANFAEQRGEKNVKNNNLYYSRTGLIKARKVLLKCLMAVQTWTESVREGKMFIATVLDPHFF